MPVSRLHERPQVDLPQGPDVAADALGLPPREPAASPDRGADAPSARALATAIAPSETVLGPVGPVRAARWNAQLPASAGVGAGAVRGASSNADATSS